MYTLTIITRNAGVSITQHLHVLEANATMVEIIKREKNVIAFLHAPSGALHSANIEVAI